MKQLVLVGLVSFVVGSAVTAGAAVRPWRVFATGSDTGAYVAFANASADAPRSHAYAYRATSSPGKLVKLNVTMICSGDVQVRSGTVVAAVPFLFSKCNLSGSATTDYPGRVKIELLRR
ncbi:MAG TPA: hypothetical protein VH760_10320 [Gaiellaceae bacterium]|jgi:hypothetical protein